jgi:chitin disaccharide deacetylase
VRRLIVNADDFGMTTGINRAIVEGCEQGIVTSATLMANSKSFHDAVACAHELTIRKPRFSVGCHVVLLDGEPVLRLECVSTLLQPPQCEDDARFQTSLKGFASAALRNKLNPEQIQAEAEAQIDYIQSAGIAVSHFDTHKHAHMFPQVLRPLLRAAKARGVRAVRNPFGRIFPLPFNRILRNPKLWMRLAEMNVMRTFAAKFRGEVHAHGLRTPDGSVGVLVTGVVNQDYFSSIAENLPEGTWEFVCHPGYNDAELDRVRTRLRKSREEELHVLTSADTKSELQRRGIELISYHDL